MANLPETKPPAKTATFVDPAGNLSQEPVDEDDDTGGRKMDVEIRVISKLLRELASMDEPARRRVVAYVASRFQ